MVSLPAGYEFCKENLLVLDEPCRELEAASMPALSSAISCSSFRIHSLCSLMVFLCSRYFLCSSGSEGGIGNAAPVCSGSELFMFTLCRRCSDSDSLSLGRRTKSSASSCVGSEGGCICRRDCSLAKFVVARTNLGMERVETGKRSIGPDVSVVGDNMDGLNLVVLAAGLAAAAPGESLIVSKMAPLLGARAGPSGALRLLGLVTWSQLSLKEPSGTSLNLYSGSSTALSKGEDRSQCSRSGAEGAIPVSTGWEGYCEAEGATSGFANLIEGARGIGSAP